jgi:hypothetical protein
MWGKALRAGAQSRARLFWTVAPKTAVGKATDLYPLQEFELPEDFWTDLAQWLGLLIENQARELGRLSGIFSFN